MRSILLGLFPLMLLGACSQTGQSSSEADAGSGDEAPYSAGNGDSDSDSDSDGDMDGDSDTGSDGDSDSDGDMDGDSDTGTGIGELEWAPVEDLPIIEEMPDPLTMNDGTKVTTLEHWNVRRQEMIPILEAYEYGHMPPPPGNVTGEVTTPVEAVTTGGLQVEYRKLRLSLGPEESLGFDLGLFTPVTPPEGEAAGYPVLIYLTYSADKSSLADAVAAMNRGYAVATAPYQQLGADSSSYASTAFFPAYSDYDWRDFSAWAWGLSRAVDYLVTDPLIDAEKIMVTGVSRLGQAVLVAGAFDELPPDDQLP